MNQRVTLDGNEAEVVLVVFTAILQGKMPELRASEGGIVRSVMHRIRRALEPETTVLTEPEPE